MDRRDFIKAVGVGAAASFMAPELFAQSPKRPNILWISTEDIGPMHGCYGDPVAVTPTIDRLAQQGVRYTNAFTCAGVCAPSRYSIITGRYPTSDGTLHMRSGINVGREPIDYYAKLPEGVQFFTEILRSSGYYCTNNAKEDYQVDTPPNAWDDSSRTAHWRNRPNPSQPFFHVINFLTTHESQTHQLDAPPPLRWGIPEGQKVPNVHNLPIQNRGELPAHRRVNPQDVRVPPYYPDTPAVRQMLANNYDNVSVMDMQCEAVLKQLEEDGLADDTIVFYWSDHGGPLARGKRWVYDSGISVPLIVRIPEKFRTDQQGQPGKMDHQLVSFIDFAPTMLNLAGLEIPSDMQGRAFLGTNLSTERDYIYAARDRMDERYDTVRTVRDKRFQYIRNYQPHKPAYQYIDFAERGPIQQEIRRLEVEGILSPLVAKMLAPNKPVEELYDLDADPYEVHNLAESKAYANTLVRLRKAHENWTIETRDVGLMPEPEMIRAIQKNGSADKIFTSETGLTHLKTIRTTADAARRGDQTTLLAALKSDDASVRFWGAVGLGLVKQGKDKLKQSLKDASPSVRVASAQSLIQMGRANEATPVLLTSLTHEDPWIRLMAALAIDENDAVAKTVLDQLPPYREDKSKYVARVVNRTLNRIQGTSEQVR